MIPLLMFIVKIVSTMYLLTMQSEFQITQQQQQQQQQQLNDENDDDYSTHASQCMDDIIENEDDNDEDNEKEEEIDFNELFGNYKDGLKNPSILARRLCFKTIQFLLILNEFHL